MLSMYGCVFTRLQGVCGAPPPADIFLALRVSTFLYLVLLIWNIQNETSYILFLCRFFEAFLWFFCYVEHVLWTCGRIFLGCIENTKLTDVRDINILRQKIIVCMSILWIRILNEFLLTFINQFFFGIKIYLSVLNIIS